jgi:hypothetical protein
MATFQLSVEQLQILYNFQRNKVLADIQDEKNLEKKHLKQKWLNDWMIGIEDISTQLRQVSTDSAPKANIILRIISKIISWLKTLFSSKKPEPEQPFITEWYDDELLIEQAKMKLESNNELWFQLVIFESEIFQPYYSLSVNESGDPSQYSEFILCKYNPSVDWLSSVLKDQYLLDTNYLKDIRKSFKKSVSKFNRKISISAILSDMAKFFAVIIPVAIFFPAAAGVVGVLTPAFLFLSGKNDSRGEDPEFTVVEASRLETIFFEIIVKRQKNADMAMSLISGVKYQLSLLRTIEIEYQKLEQKDKLKNISNSIKIIEDLLKTMENLYANAFDSPLIS